MKKYLKFAAFCLTMAVVAPLTTACSDDPKEEEVKADTTALQAELTACETLLANAKTTDYPQDAIDAFKKVVAAVKAGLEKNPSQTEVDNMLKQLEEAKVKFLAAAYDALPTDKMVCAWDFETEGDALKSNGVKDWEAVLTTGPKEIFGSDTQKPTFVEGVKGGKAINFAKGGHLEVANYTTGDLLKDELSIAVWVKPTTTTPGNYIISLNYWNTFKFNLQTENKPFFTAATKNADGTAGIIDADNEVAESVKNNAWTHLVVTISYKEHTMKFYVNGELTKTWDQTGKPQLANNAWYTDWKSACGKTLPLMIGMNTTYEEASAWSWFSKDTTAEQWLNDQCFQGAIDQLKVFTVALTDGQAKKLYNDEK